MAGPLNRKAAPRRTIEWVDRVGPWGNIVYRHGLDCGHIEDRKRHVTSTTMACTACATPAPQIPPAPPGRPDPPDDDQLAVAKLTATIAHRLGVDPHSVSLSFDKDGWAWIAVLLGPAEISVLNR